MRREPELREWRDAPTNVARSLNMISSDREAVEGPEVEVLVAVPGAAPLEGRETGERSEVDVARRCPRRWASRGAGCCDGTASGWRRRR